MLQVFVFPITGKQKSGTCFATKLVRSAQVPEAVSLKNARGNAEVSAPCEDQLGRRTEGRNTTARSHAGAPLHSCIVPRQFILPFTQTTSRQHYRSADAPRGTAVKSSPQQSRAPARYCCDRLRPSKNCRLKSFSVDSTDHQQKNCPSALSLWQSSRHHPETPTRFHCLAEPSLKLHNRLPPEATRLLIRPHSHSTAFESLE